VLGYLRIQMRLLRWREGLLGRERKKKEKAVIGLGALMVLMKVMMDDDFVCTSIFSFLFFSFLFFGVGVEGWLEPTLDTLTTVWTTGRYASCKDHVKKHTYVHTTYRIPSSS
jgi:hypothetical protein